MTTNNEKLIAFAQQVGADIKALNGKADTAQQTAETAQQTAEQAYQQVQQISDSMNQAITTAKQEVKNDILGGAAEDLDTLKEIADRLAQSGQDTNGAMVQKMTEQNNRITALETTINTDYLATYNAAKA